MGNTVYQKFIDCGEEKKKVTSVGGTLAIAVIHAHTATVLEACFYQSTPTGGAISHRRSPTCTSTKKLFLSHFLVVHSQWEN